MTYQKLTPEERSRRRREWWANLSQGRREEIKKLRADGAKRKPNPATFLTAEQIIQHLRETDAGVELERRGYRILLGYSQKLVFGF